MRERTHPHRRLRPARGVHITVGAAGGGSVVADAAAVDGAAQPVELYREEAAVYSALPQVAQKLGLATLGTFHQRQGDQALSLAAATSRRMGARNGSHSSQSWAGTVSPSFDGTMAGVQVGVDILRFQSAPEHHDRAPASSCLWLGQRHR